MNIYGQSCTVTASYLSDALSEFLRAVNYMLAGGKDITFSFDEEPGEYRWLLSRKPNNGLKIKILDFQAPWDGTTIWKANFHFHLKQAALKRSEDIR